MRLSSVSPRTSDTLRSSNTLRAVSKASPNKIDVSNRRVAPMTKRAGAALVRLHRESEHAAQRLRHGREGRETLPVAESGWTNRAPYGQKVPRTQE